ncbi:MAG: hypothetical protein EPN41_06975 [Candidimonas sp.]|nr:MAG: hypothetical protein EPN41_06975 [Candidimonas sp.]
MSPVPVMVCDWVIIDLGVPLRQTEYRHRYRLLVRTSRGRRGSFYFILNWAGADDSVVETTAAFKQRSRHALALIADIH